MNKPETNLDAEYRDFNVARRNMEIGSTSSQRIDWNQNVSGRSLIKLAKYFYMSGLSDATKKSIAKLAEIREGS